VIIDVELIEVDRKPSSRSKGPGRLRRARIAPSINCNVSKSTTGHRNLFVGALRNLFRIPDILLALPCRRSTTGLAPRRHDHAHARRQPAAASTTAGVAAQAKTVFPANSCRFAR